MNELFFTSEAIEKNLTRLTNQVWKLIPMRENEENWKKQLETIQIEAIGLSLIFTDSSEYLQIISKILGLKEENTEFSLYRKTVFEIINLLQEIKNAQKG